MKLPLLLYQTVTFPLAIRRVSVPRLSKKQDTSQPRLRRAEPVSRIDPQRTSGHQRTATRHDHE